MIKHYSILNEDKLKVRNVAEKIFHGKEKLIGKLITWESFTMNWLWFDLPKSELDRKNWIENRPKWIQILNKEFIKWRYPCKLYVAHGKGVQLFEHGAMINKFIANSTKKILNASTNTIDRCEELLQTDTEGKKLLRQYKRLNTEKLYTWSGMIGHSKLSGGLKSEMKKLIDAELKTNSDFLDLDTA